MMAEMLDLPNEVLGLIARQVVEKQGGLRLWCKLSSTCRRLGKIELPSESACVLDYSLTTQGDCFPCHAGQPHVQSSPGVGAQGSEIYMAVFEGFWGNFRKAVGIEKIAAGMQAEPDCERAF